jgi:hypothetical protein
MSGNQPVLPPLRDPVTHRLVDPARDPDYRSFVAGHAVGHEPVAAAFTSDAACHEWVSAEQTAGRLPSVRAVTKAELETARHRPVEEFERKQAEKNAKVAQFAAETGLEPNSVELVRRAVAEHIAEDPTILYDGLFGGSSVTLWGALPDLANVGFRNRAVSAAVIVDFGTLFTGLGWQGAKFRMIGIPFAQFDLTQFGFSKDTQSFYNAWVF